MIATVRNPFARAVAAHGYWWSHVSFAEFVRLLLAFRSGAPDPLLDAASRGAPQKGRRKMSLSRPRALSKKW